MNIPRVLAGIAAVADPEMPFLTIEDLGILRQVVVDRAAGVVDIVLTPTYLGCPASEVIVRRVERVAAGSGLAAHVDLRHDPPWTSDWITPAGRKALRENGIAEPEPVSPAGPVTIGLPRMPQTCPNCGSSAVVQTSRFGATACKALMQCAECREPFERFKAI